MKAFDKLCSDAEFAKEAPTPSDGKSLFESLEAKLKAGHSSTHDQLKDEFKDKSLAELQSALERNEKLLRGGTLSNSGKVREQVAKLKSEIERRMNSKAWLATAKVEQAEVNRGSSPHAGPQAQGIDDTGHRPSAKVVLSVPRKPQSIGERHVQATGRKGKQHQAERTPQPQVAQKRPLLFEPSHQSAGTPRLQEQECPACEKLLPIAEFPPVQDEELGPVCYGCTHGDGAAHRSVKGKGRADDQDMFDAYAKLESYSDDDTRGGGDNGEAGPSGLSLKENQQPPLHPQPGPSKGAKAARPDLMDTRQLTAPKLKGTAGGGGTISSRAGTAEPKSGTQPAAFYGQRCLGAMQDTPADSAAGAVRRQSSRVQKREAEQSKEPITLDDTDDEEGAAPAGAAQGRPRRTLRNNAYRGPADVFKGLKALYPELGGPGAVEVVPADLVRLQPGEFLNDTIIDFYMRYIWQHMPEATRDRCYFYNSFFYKKLSEKQPGLPAVSATGRCEAAKAAHERVRKWTKGVDIFSKDFLFLPIHDHLHWSLVIICHAAASAEDGQTCTPWILHLDSMSSGHQTSKIKKELLAYLTQEWDHKVAQGGDSVPAVWAVAHPEVPQRSLDVAAKKLQLPQQDNFCDCGLFLLTYAEFFTHSLPGHIRTKSRQRLDPAELEGLSSYPLFMQRQWFQPEVAGALRGHIRNLILELFVSQVPEDQKQALEVALTAAGTHIMDYTEDARIPKYMPPSEYEKTGQERKRRMEEDKERKAAAEKAKAAERKEHSQERRRKSGQGSLLPDLPNISDGEHAADDRPALRSGKRKHADPAREANNDSPDIEICLDDPAAPDSSEDKPTHLSPSGRAAAGMAEKLKHDNKREGDRPFRRLAAHVLESDEEDGDTTAAKPEDSTDVIPPGHVHSTSKVINLPWIEQTVAGSLPGADEAPMLALQAPENAPEDLTGDEDPSNERGKSSKLAPGKDLFQSTAAGLSVLAYGSGLARVTADLIASAPGYLAEARDPVGTRSEDSLAAATERAKWLDRFAQPQSASLLVPAGTGARNAAAGQQQRPEASIPKSSAQRQQLSINELQRTLAQPPPISYRPAAPAATFQRKRKKKQTSCADRPELESSSEEAGGGDFAAAPAESHIDLVSDNEAPPGPAADGCSASASRQPVRTQADANGNSSAQACQDSLLSPCKEGATPGWDKGNNSADSQGGGSQDGWTSDSESEWTPTKNRPSKHEKRKRRGRSRHHRTGHEGFEKLQPQQDMRNDGIAGMNGAIEYSPGKWQKRKGVHSPSANHRRRHSKSPKTRSLRSVPEIPDWSQPCRNALFL